MLTLERIKAAQGKYELCGGSYRGSIDLMCCPLTMVYLAETGTDFHQSNICLAIREHFDIDEFITMFDDPESELHVALRPAAPIRKALNNWSKYYEGSD